MNEKKLRGVVSPWTLYGDVYQNFFFIAWRLISVCRGKAQFCDCCWSRALYIYIYLGVELCETFPSHLIDKINKKGPIISLGKTGITFIARRQVFVMWSSVEVALPIQLALCKFAVYFSILCKYSFAFHGVDRHTAWLRSSFTTVWLYILCASTAMYRSVSSLWKRDNEQCLSQKLFLMGTF